MNEPVPTLSGAAKAGFGGLPQRLVEDGLVSSADMADALVAARERKIQIVSWIVSQNIASARDIAIAAAHEVGAPRLDLDAVVVDMAAVRLVNDKLPNHRLQPTAATILCRCG